MISRVGLIIIAKGDDSCSYEVEADGWGDAGSAAATTVPSIPPRTRRHPPTAALRIKRFDRPTEMLRTLKGRRDVVQGHAVGVRGHEGNLDVVVVSHGIADLGRPRALAVHG